MTLTEFLLARLTEDEAAVAPPFDRNREDCGIVKDHRGDFDAAYIGGCHRCGLGPCRERGTQGAVRALAEIEVKRQILSEHEGDEKFDPILCGVCHYDNGGDEAYPCRTLRLLVQPYTRHPDYREEWRA